MSDYLNGLFKRRNCTSDGHRYYWRCKKAHPAAQAALELISVGSAGELAEAIASVGLAQNLAAKRALADDCIQRGHMRLHARTVAITAGASPEQVIQITQKVIEHGALNAETAQHFLKVQKP